MNIEIRDIPQNKLKSTWTALDVGSQAQVSAYIYYPIKQKSKRLFLESFYNKSGSGFV
ncbi:conserved hypothetical protein [Ricinus communis]|uniref:Uncharacterized protein n=1 Tax=Ricinus communis TaxID=3988 RepID=B9S2B3_RICCO|nr:conserved hypothetical protein [Ricinus communis]